MLGIAKQCYSARATSQDVLGARVCQCMLANVRECHKNTREN